MKIYKVVSSIGYQFFDTDSLETTGKLLERNFDDEKSFVFTKITSEELKHIGDIALVNSATLFFSKKAKEIYSESGEFFRFTNLDDFELFMPQIIDALDYEKSEFKYFRDGRIMGIKNFFFKESLIKDLEAFKIKGFCSYPTFLTDKFVEKYKANNLTGIEFFCVYDSENPANVGKFIQEM